MPLLLGSPSLRLIWAALVGRLTHVTLIGDHHQKCANGKFYSEPLKQGYSNTATWPHSSFLETEVVEGMPRRIGEAKEELKMQHFLQTQCSESGGVSGHEVGPNLSLRLMH